MSNSETVVIAPTTRARTVRGYIVFAFAVALVLAAAYLMRQILLLLYVSALFAVVLSPVIHGIMRIHIGKWHPGKGLAILLLVLAITAAAALFFAFALPPVVHDLQSLITELPKRGPQVLDQVHRIPFISHVDLSGVKAKVQGFASNFAEYLLVSITGWASKLADVGAVIFLTVYFMLEGDEAYHWILSFFPKRTRARLNDTLLRADVRMGKWLLGQAGLMLILGLCSLIVFVLFKIRYAYALAVLMGTLNIIPIVGAMVSMALVLLAAATDSWEKVVAVSVFYAIYAQVETSFLTPRIMKSSVDLSALGVLVALLMGSKLAGVIGAMIAVPTAVLVTVLIDEYLVQHDEPEPAAEAVAAEVVR
ncbi:MAG TPA: AI-2E family transporter [Acidobacteriaceae bacterium]|nr:AI-2E family transporter [Acidobacteriaceae bacterium]